MVFLFYTISIIFIFFIIFITSKIEFNLIEFNFESRKKLKVDLKIRLYIFKKIPIFSIRIANKQIKEFEETKTFKKIKANLEKQISKMGRDVLTNKEAFDIEIIKKSTKILKKLKIGINKINLNIEVGTQNIILTSFLVPIISTLISFFIKSNSICLTEANYKVLPKYKIKEEFLNMQISLKAVFEIKILEVFIILKQIKKENIFQSCIKKR